MSDSTFSPFSVEFPPYVTDPSEEPSAPSEPSEPSVKKETKKYKQFSDWFNKILDQLEENDPSLISLDLTNKRFTSKKRITSEMAKALASVLETNTSLENLILDYYNPIHSDGARAIANALKTNKTLKLLSIAHNPIGIRGIEAIADMLTINRCLTHVYLTNESLFPFRENLCKLVEVAKTNTSLVNLHLTKDVGIDDLRSLELENVKDITSMQWVEWN
jgi:Ran GTPase-activating protein (RanGAP) involved in mRNA processing and transport